MQIHISSQVMERYAGACFGFLAVENAAAPSMSPALEAAKARLQAELREAYPTEAAIKSDPVIQAYTAYYKRFKKSYHVAMQLESIALKGKTVPSVAPLVECMFMAELADRTLTAVHDLAKVQGEITVGVAEGHEVFTLLRGEEQQLKQGDLYMRDALGVVSSIIYGPDSRTQITSNANCALFTSYAPPGVGALRLQVHLAHIREYVRLVCPESRVLIEQVF